MTQLDKSNFSLTPLIAADAKAVKLNQLIRCDAGCAVRCELRFVPESLSKCFPRVRLQLDDWLAGSAMQRLCRCVVDSSERQVQHQIRTLVVNPNHDETMLIECVLYGRTEYELRVSINDSGLIAGSIAMLCQHSDSMVCH